MNRVAVIDSSSVKKDLLNGNNSNKNNEHYVDQLVTELKTQSLITVGDNRSDTFINNNRSNDRQTSEIKSAKDFFDSLPVSSQSSIDFSFGTQLPADIPSSSVPASNSSSIIREVPSVLEDQNKVVIKQDSQSDHSESVPITPSEQDKSDISTSSAELSPKEVSQVLEFQLQDIDSKLGAEINKNKILSEQLQQSVS